MMQHSWTWQALGVLPLRHQTLTKSLGCCNRSLQHGAVFEAWLVADQLATHSAFTCSKHQQQQQQLPQSLCRMQQQHVQIGALSRRQGRTTVIAGCTNDESPCPDSKPLKLLCVQLGLVTSLRSAVTASDL
jgi:hypothetical protein